MSEQLRELQLLNSSTPPLPDEMDEDQQTLYLPNHSHDERDRLIAAQQLELDEKDLKIKELEAQLVAQQQIIDALREQLSQSARLKGKDQSVTQLIRQSQLPSHHKTQESRTSWPQAREAHPPPPPAEKESPFDKDRVMKRAHRFMTPSSTSTNPAPSLDSHPLAPSAKRMKYNEALSDSTSHAGPNEGTGGGGWKSTAPAPPRPLPPQTTEFSSVINVRVRSDAEIRHDILAKVLRVDSFDTFRRMTLIVNSDPANQEAFQKDVAYTKGVIQKLNLNVLLFAPMATPQTFDVQFSTSPEAQLAAKKFAQGYALPSGTQIMFQATEIPTPLDSVTRFVRISSPVVQGCSIFASNDDETVLRALFSEEEKQFMNFAGRVTPNHQFYFMVKFGNGIEAHNFCEKYDGSYVEHHRLDVFKCEEGSEEAKDFLRSLRSGRF